MDKKCKKLGSRATKAERYEAHRAKLEMKEAMKPTFHQENPHVFANQSQHHENWGETPAEQDARMRENNS
jgi:hypothetical protein